MVTYHVDVLDENHCCIKCLYRKNCKNRWRPDDRMEDMICSDFTRELDDRERMMFGKLASFRRNQPEGLGQAHTRRVKIRFDDGRRMHANARRGCDSAMCLYPRPRRGRAKGYPDIG